MYHNLFKTTITKAVPDLAVSKQSKAKQIKILSFLPCFHANTLPSQLKCLLSDFSEVYIFYYLYNVHCPIFDKWDNVLAKKEKYIFVFGLVFKLKPP